MSRVEAVIVAGGLGTRLLPLTARRPKHLLPVAGVPFVEHQIAKLAQAGVRRVVLATSYHAEAFAPVLGDGSRWGLKLVYVTEEKLLGTAGAIRYAASALDPDDPDPVVILNGDILSGHDLRAQLRRHRESRADVTLHLVEVDDARAYGCVPTTADGRVTAFLEKSPDPVSRQINAGCYLFDKAVISSIPADRVVSVERETFPALLDEGRRLIGFVEQSYWRDVGTPAALCRASSDLVRGIARSPAYRAEPAEAWAHPDAEVAASAVLVGGSAVEAGAVIGEDARVEASVVGADASIGARSRLVGSVLGPGARVGTGAVLTGTAVGDGAEVGDRCELVDGARVASGARLSAGAVRFSPDL